MLVVTPKISTTHSRSAAVTRLSSLTLLSSEEMDALSTAEGTRQHVRAQGEILVEGAPVREASIILSGWACRVRQFPNGRRQLLGLLLPGELVGECRQRSALATASVIALTDVTLCARPDPRARPGLAEAYAVSAAIEESYIFRQIARLGRLTAYERILDWLLEVQERLAIAGLAEGGRFPLPMTQEMLADMLGLTSVHVNRTLQILRREGVLELSGGSVLLREQDRLAELVDYRSVTVTAG
jgi:CRP-like cAMP-binding protein